MFGRTSLHCRNCFKFRLDDLLLEEFVKMDHRIAFAGGLVYCAELRLGRRDALSIERSDADAIRYRTGDVVSKPILLNRCLETRFEGCDDPALKPGISVAALPMAMYRSRDVDTTRRLVCAINNVGRETRNNGLAKCG